MAAKKISNGYTQFVSVSDKKILDSMCGYRIYPVEPFYKICKRAWIDSHMGFDGYYVSEFCGVMVKIEPFSLKEGFENETLTEYIENVIENNGQDAVPEEKDGLVYYRYYNGGNAGWNFAYKGSDAFYLVQFICREDHETKLSDAIFSFAGSVTVR